MLDKFSTESRVSEQQLADYRRDGFLIARGLFTASEVSAFRRHFEDLVGGRWQLPPTLWQPQPDSEEILDRFPRVMQPHRADAFSRSMLLHDAVREVVTALLGEEPAAAQSMFYFKPPGARGQAMHQDNFYLAVKPGSCLAAWTAIDPSTPENGGLFVVPETQDLEVQCPERADQNESYFRDLVRPPPGKKAVPAILAPGDTLFFNGSVIHGSGPNRSPDTWRRSFICHYVPRSAEYVSAGYFPLLDFDGQEVPFKKNEDGGPCGDGWRPSSYVA